MGISIPSILTPRVGWWVKLSMTAHLKTMKSTDELTENVREVLSSALSSENTKY